MSQQAVSDDERLEPVRSHSPRKSVARVYETSQEDMGVVGLFLSLFVWFPRRRGFLGVDLVWVCG